MGNYSVRGSYHDFIQTFLSISEAGTHLKLFKILRQVHIEGYIHCLRPPKVNI